MKKLILFSSGLLLLPLVTLAQFGGVDTFFININTFINNVLVPLVFGLALLVFIYGMFQYFILGGASDDSREKGRQLIIWAVIGFVMMVSIWGIVNLIAGSLGVNNNAPTTPTGPTIGGSRN